MPDPKDKKPKNLLDIDAKIDTALFKIKNFNESFIF